jgi:uncharacterized protein YjaZ
MTTAYGRPSIPMDHLPEIVAHELIHALQPPLSSNPTLLELSMHEGIADAVDELIAGSRVLDLNGREVHAYGRENEARLWPEFQQAMHGNSSSGWLYGTPLKDRPQNLGYFFGYRIAKAYFDSATDKRAAVAELITLPNGAKAILERSGYPTALRKVSPASPGGAR